MNDPAPAQVANLFVSVTQFPHQALCVLSGECAMGEAPIAAEKLTTAP